MICDCLENIRSPDYSLYAPRQEPPAGTLLSQEESPILFHPIKIRSLNIHNRILVSPMCQYSAENGHMTDWHLVHYGSFAIQGPGLTMLECTSVTAAGRTNVGDSGLWVDSQIAPLKRIADFFHSQNQKLGIQLSHAGRKSSCLAPWMKLLTSAPVEAGGWPDQVIGPSNEPWNEDMAVPREMTIQDIQETTEAFARAAKRAIQANVNCIEIQGAHGHLLNSFCSPAVNKRSDIYGGTFENRIRFPLEVIRAVRTVIPFDMPLFYRISATDRLSPGKGWEIEDTIRFARILHKQGIDVLDVSSGGNDRNEFPSVTIDYQISLAARIKKEIPDILVSAVGSITNGKRGNEIIKTGFADVVFIGRAFLQNQSVVGLFAQHLDSEGKIPLQYTISAK